MITGRLERFAGAMGNALLKLVGNVLLWVICLPFFLLIACIPLIKFMLAFAVVASLFLYAGGVVSGWIVWGWFALGVLVYLGAMFISNK